MSSKQPADDGVVEDFQHHQGLKEAKGKPVSQFKPTELDRALARDPVSEAAHRDLLAATQKEGSPLDKHSDTMMEQSPLAPPVEPANRHGQREAAAASLAGGMIAAEGRPVTAAEAVEKVEEVMNELERRE